MKLGNWTPGFAEAVVKVPRMAIEHISKVPWKETQIKTWLLVHLVILPLRNEVRGGPGTLSRGDLHRNREEILQITHTTSAAGRQRPNNIVGDWGDERKSVRF